MGIAAKLDDIGKPAWIGLMVLSFFAYWPLGLAVLAFLIWSGRMGCWKYAGQPGNGHWGYCHWGMGFCGPAGWWRAARNDEGANGGPDRGRYYGPSSGNRAFDEYRAETLRRLEEEQREFKDFLERLRHAKDKAEFDQFMSERRRGAEGPQPPPETP
jgi:Protein of unknown function (DUF2852)